MSTAKAVAPLSQGLKQLRRKSSAMIAVGRISKGVGIKGEMHVASLSDNPERFAKLKTVWIGRDEATVGRFTIDSIRPGRSGFVVKLREVESRSVADTKRGEFVFIEEEIAGKPPPGSYYVHDIIGMEIRTEQDEALGVIKDVLQLPANDVWVILRDGKEVLIPAIKDVIVSVDLERRIVVIRPIEGLLDI